MSQVLPLFSCTCAVSLRLHGKLSERPDSTGFCLSRPGAQRSAQFSYILTYKATEMQGSAAAPGTTVGEAGVRSAREGGVSCLSAVGLRNLRRASWVGSGDPINVLEESLGEVGRSLGDLSGVALCSLLGFTGAATGTSRTLELVTGGVAITRSKVNTRAGRHGPTQPAELGGRSHLRRAGAEAIPPLPNRGPSSPPDDPRKRRVTTQGPSGLPQGWGRVSISELRARQGRPLLIGRSRGSRTRRSRIGATGGQSRSNWTLGCW